MKQSTSKQILYLEIYLPSIPALLELYPDDDAKSDQTSIMAEHVFHNTKVIDKSNHWSLLLYQESLAIQRYKPELNHGLKASKELIIFN